MALLNVIEPGGPWLRIPQIRHETLDAEAVPRILHPFLGRFRTTVRRFCSSRPVSAAQGLHRAWVGHGPLGWGHGPLGRPAAPKPRAKAGPARVQRAEPFVHPPPPNRMHVAHVQRIIHLGYAEAVRLPLSGTDERGGVEWAKRGGPCRSPSTSSGEPAARPAQEKETREPNAALGALMNT